MDSETGQKLIENMELKMNIVKSLKEEIKDWKIFITQERNKELSSKEYKRHGYIHGDYMNEIPSSLYFNDGREGDGAPQYFYTAPASPAKEENGNPVVDYEKSSDTYFILLKNGEKLYITKKQKVAIEAVKEDWVKYWSPKEKTR